MYSPLARHSKLRVACEVNGGSDVPENLSGVNLLRSEIGIIFHSAITLSGGFGEKSGS